MTTARDVADWIFANFENSKYIYQETIVYKIKEEFGADFFYTNKSGNLAIGRDVLKEFRKITEGKVVWERSDRAWRKLRDNENYKGRQVG